MISRNKRSTVSLDSGPGLVIAHAAHHLGFALRAVYALAILQLPNRLRQTGPFRQQLE